MSVLSFFKVSGSIKWSLERHEDGQPEWAETLQHLERVSMEQPL